MGYRVDMGVYRDHLFLYNSYGTADGRSWKQGGTRTKNGGSSMQQKMEHETDTGSLWGCMGYNQGLRFTCWLLVGDKGLEEKETTMRLGVLSSLLQAITPRP